MNFYYKSYYLQVRKHKTTGKILDERWECNAEYETEEEARADLEQDRLAHPELKWKLVKEAWEVLYED